jgi:hypothetical protein
VARFTEALSAIERLPQSGKVMTQAIDLRFSLRTSLSPLGEFHRSFELLREAETIATTLNDQARLARVFTFKALYYWSTGQQDRTLEAPGRRWRPRRASAKRPRRCWPTCSPGARAMRAATMRRPSAARGRGGRDRRRPRQLPRHGQPALVSARTWFPGRSPSAANSGRRSRAVRKRSTLPTRSTTSSAASTATSRSASRICARATMAMAIANLERALQFSETQNLRMARAMVAGYLGRAYTLSNRPRMRSRS